MYSEIYTQIAYRGERFSISMFVLTVFRGQKVFRDFNNKRTYRESVKFNFRFLY